MGDSGIGWGFLIVFLLGFFVGCWAASVRANLVWEGMLIDSPEQVELIRQRVIAERAEKVGAK